MPFYDAHCHLQDPRFDHCRDALLENLTSCAVRECISNGTSPEDWSILAHLSTHPKVRPAFGLHPWKVMQAPPDWFEQLEQRLIDHPGALIGEIGLDRWIRNAQFPKQMEAFERQLELAASLNIPPSIHCLRAWGNLHRILERYAPRLPGFLLHSYTGPSEMTAGFVKLGAYFSLSGYFLHPKKHHKLEAWRAIPPDRILIETDCPDMGLPTHEHQSIPNTGKSCSELNHPCNLPAIYDFAARTFGLEPTDFATQVEQNYCRLFAQAAKH